jgi:hypothetical protein
MEPGAVHDEHDVTSVGSKGDSFDKHAGRDRQGPLKVRADLTSVNWWSERRQHEAC